MPFWIAFKALPRGFHIALAVIALCGLLFTLHKCAVRDAVKDDRKASQGEVAKKQLGAERAANESDAARQTEIQADDAAVRSAINETAAKNPEKAIAPAGPVTNRAVDELRRRKAGSSASPGR